MLAEIQDLAAGLGPANFFGSFTVFLDHGLLIVEDSNSQARHDEWNETSDLVDVRPDSICIRTQVYVDGPVSVFIFRGIGPLAVGRQAFAGTIGTPSKILTVEDSDKTAQVHVRVAGEETAVTALVDDDRYVGCVALLLPE
jgi:hypothetical protein